MTKLEENWKVGLENARESERFRWPVFASYQAPELPESWPWIGLFETREGAERAAHRVNEYPSLRTEIASLRKELRQAQTASTSWGEWASAQCDAPPAKRRP